MKKFLTITLSLLLIFLLVSCTDKDANDSSSQTDSVPNEIYPETEGEVYWQQLNFYDPEAEGYTRYYNLNWSIKRGEYADVYIKGDEISFIYKCISDNPQILELYYAARLDIETHRSEASDTIYLNSNLDRLPYIYYLIREYNIPKSAFIKAHEEHKAQWSNSLFTDEEIDILYSADTAAVKECFANSWTIVHGGKTYPIAFFNMYGIDRWKEENIPPEKIRELLDSFPLPPESEKFTKEDGTAMRAWEGMPEIKSKLSEYEKLFPPKS